MARFRPPTIGAARGAAADFLSALGIDVDWEEMRETPARMARAYAELFSTPPLRLTTFASDEGLRRAGVGPGDPVPHGLRASPRKSALDAITPVLARELSARDITVNAIAPTLERPGAAADIANLVAFLVSEDGRWVNGQVIRANGVIGSQTQGHGPGISRVRGTARSATQTRSTSTPGGHHEHH